MTALSKDPHQRFTSVLAFATALEQASQRARSIPIVSTPDPLPPTQIVKVKPVPPTQPVVAKPVPPTQPVTTAPSLAILNTYHGHEGEVKAVSWSPDSKYLASSSRDDTVQIWSATTGKRVVTYRGYNVSNARKMTPESMQLRCSCYAQAERIGEEYTHPGQFVVSFLTYHYC
jgi:eukaryotic-like serine/threonine-protein kinase